MSHASRKNLSIRMTPQLSWQATEGGVRLSGARGVMNVLIQRYKTPFRHAAQNLRDSEDS